MFLIVVRSIHDHIHVFFTVTNLMPGPGFSRLLRDAGYQLESSCELFGRFTADEKGALLHAFGQAYLSELGASSESVTALELHDSHFVPVQLNESAMLLSMSSDEHVHGVACMRAVNLGREAARNSFQPA